MIFYIIMNSKVYNGFLIVFYMNFSLYSNVDEF